jgi:hypothetical protein
LRPLTGKRARRIVRFFRERRIRMARQTRQFLGITPRRWLEYLIAILIGNAIFYFSLMPHLPDSLRHHGFQTDWGTALDLAVCAAVYGLIRIATSL